MINWVFLIFVSKALQVTSLSKVGSRGLTHNILLFAKLIVWLNKLEYLIPTVLTSLVLFLWVWSETYTRKDHPKAASLV